MASGGPGLRRKPLRKVRKSLAGRYYQLLSGHAAIGSFLHERMIGPLRRESSERRWCGSGKRVAPPPFRGVSGLASPDPEAVEVGGKGLRVEAPYGAGGEKAVERGSHGGGFRVPGGHVSWKAVVGRDGEGAQEEAGEGEISEGEEGSPRPP